MPDLLSRLVDAALTGMTASVWADVKPDAIALYDPYGTRNFFQVNANANRAVRLLRAHGLVAGDAVALMCSNRAEFVEVFSATLRAGFRITPGELASSQPTRSNTSSMIARQQGAHRRNPLSRGPDCEITLASCADLHRR